MWGAIISGLFSAGGSVLGGQGAKRAGAENARLELMAANDTAKIIRRRAREAQGSATSAYAASGVDVGSGTPTLVSNQIAYDSEIDAMNALLTGKRRATAAKAGGAIAAQQSALDAGGALYTGWLRAREQNTAKAGG